MYDDNVANLLPFDAFKNNNFLEILKNDDDNFDLFDPLEEIRFNCKYFETEESYNFIKNINDIKLDVIFIATNQRTNIYV